MKLYRFTRTQENSQQFWRENLVSHVGYQRGASISVKDNGALPKTQKPKMRKPNLWSLRDGKRAKMRICVAIWSTGPPPSTKICSYTNGIFLVKKDFIRPNKKSQNHVLTLATVLKARQKKTETITMPPVRSKRGTGYSQVELDSLLNLLEQHLPISGTEWDRVEAAHKVKFPLEDRSRDSLKCKFQDLYRTKIPTGDPFIP